MDAIKAAMKKESKYMTVGVRDFVWGLVYAISPVLIPIGKIFTSGAFPPGSEWYSALMKSVPIISVYLVVHFFKGKK